MNISKSRGSNGERFLKAFQRVEGYLRKRTKTKERTPFGKMLEEALKSDPILRHYEKDLKTLKNLRNVLVHDTEGLLAEPTDKAVELMEKIAEHLLNPPLVEPDFFREVATVAAQAPIAEAVNLMYEHDYSQVPVIQDGEVQALLTANTIARWLGALVTEEIFSLSETPVREVLRYAEESETWECIPRNVTLFDVLERFERYEKVGKRLAALLVTHGGKRTEKLLGIITPWDLVQVHQILASRHIEGTP